MQARHRDGVQELFAIAALSFGLLSFGAAAQAQTCGTHYSVKSGESLADIAAKVYGNSSQWPLIFYANQDRMGANASLLVPGVSIRIPCLGGQQPVSIQTPSAVAPAEPGGPSAAIELSTGVTRIEFLTADGFSPFTDRSLPHGGMITNVVSAEMDLIKEQSGGKFSYNITWINDWAAHLNPLLTTRAFDVGFPWVKPDCDRQAELSQDAKYRCQKFFFSDPLYESFTVLFVKSNSPVKFAKDDEIIGKTLCQPAGRSTYELDKGGRNWVKDNKIVLLQPQSIEECFRLLDAGSVTAVVSADLTGKAVVAALGLNDRIKVLQRPLDIGTLHLIVSKTHPHASTLLYYINTAAAKLRETGEYDKIIDDHLSLFWSTQERK